MHARIVTEITDRVEGLSEELQMEVLDYVEHLSEHAQWQQMSLKNALKGQEDEPVFYTEADLKESFS